MTPDAGPVKPQHPAWLGFALDFGPLLAFFVTYRVVRGSHPNALTQLDAVLTSTVVFMLAIAAALLISKVKLGRISPMLWLSAGLVIVFGGLTIWFHNPKFIQVKPTLIYALLAAVLFGGLLRGKPMLRYVLGSAWEGLSETGWLKLSRNWAWFFVAMAIANEALRHALSFDAWLTAKVWGVTAASILFGFANIPMLMRYGLDMGGKAEPPIPPQ